MMIQSSQPLRWENGIALDTLLAIAHYVLGVGSDTFGSLKGYQVRKQPVLILGALTFCDCNKRSGKGSKRRRGFVLSFLDSLFALASFSPVLFFWNCVCVSLVKYGNALYK